MLICLLKIMANEELILQTSNELGIKLVSIFFIASFLYLLTDILFAEAFHQGGTKTTMTMIVSTLPAFVFLGEMIINRVIPNILLFIVYAALFGVLYWIAKAATREEHKKLISVLQDEV